MFDTTFGEKILVEVQGYDPRSLFRGYYSRIDPLFEKTMTVDISQTSVRLGQNVYAPYILNEEGIAVFSDLTFEKPGTKSFLKGEIKRMYKKRYFEKGRKMRTDDDSTLYEVTPYFFIDSFYKSHLQSQHLEKKLRESMRSDKKSYAKLAISSSGHATIMSLLVEGDEYK